MHDVFVEKDIIVVTGRCEPVGLAAVQAPFILKLERSIQASLDAIWAYISFLCKLIRLAGYALMLLTMYHRFPTNV